MKLDDLRWAVGEAVRAAFGRQHDGCDCHPRLSYRRREGPEAAEEAASDMRDRERRPGGAASPPPRRHGP